MSGLRRSVPGSALVDEREVPRQPAFIVAVKADLAEMAKVKGTPYPSLGGLADVLTLPGMWATILWRVANELHERGLRPLSRLCYFLNIVLFGAELMPGAVVGPGVVIPHPVGIGVASGTVFGSRVRLMRAIAIGGSGDPKKPGHPHVGDDVWIMDSAKLFGPVTVGDRSIIGTGAVIANDIPADVFVYGARKSDAMRPLQEMGLEDHGGSLAVVTVAAAQAEQEADRVEAPVVEGLRLARAVGED